jgi:hypothetical protein
MNCNGGKAIRGVSTGYAGYFEGTVGFQNLQTGGSFSLCYINRSSFPSIEEVAFCSSSLRYKKDLQPFADGLSFINQLRPITFKWKTNDLFDVGVGAPKTWRESIRCLWRTTKGEVEGVKYDRLSVVFANAINEQQAQIIKQQIQIERQQREIDEMRRAVNALRQKTAARSRRPK